jgi:serine/threonine protein kinase
MKLVIHPEYNHLKDRIKEIPSCFSTRGEIIYKSRNEIKIFDTDFGKIAVKSFKIPHIINRFVYSFLRLSKAERSYAYSLKILERGFSTPHPIAYIEQFEAGLLSESYYVSTYSDGLLMRKFNYVEKLTAEDVDILKAFACFTAQLHEKEIYHSDYSPGNILYKKTGDAISFDLVDVNRVQFKKVTGKMAYKAFRRLEFPIDTLKIITGEYDLQRRAINKFYLPMSIYDC